MRVAEDMVAEVELGMIDLWRLAGQSFDTKYTWNTRNEIDRGGYFNQYYGRDTREYVARYDRMYAVNFEAQKKNSQDENGTKAIIDKATFALVANEPVGESKHHFLSDHFGIASTFKIYWKA